MPPPPPPVPVPARLGRRLVQAVALVEGAGQGPGDGGGDLELAGGGGGGQEEEDVRGRPLIGRTRGGRGVRLVGEAVEQGWGGGGAWGDPGLAIGHVAPSDDEEDDGDDTSLINALDLWRALGEGMYGALARLRYLAGQYGRFVVFRKEAVFSVLGVSVSRGHLFEEQHI